MSQQDSISEASQKASEGAVDGVDTITQRSVKLDLNIEQKESTHGSPRKGPTLSTSTSSFEALDPHDPNLSHLASLMFSQTSNYLQVLNLLNNPK